MPSDAHKTLLNRLATVTRQVQTALGENDADALERLRVRQREAMALLVVRGAVRDPALAAPLASLKAEVDQVARGLSEQLEKTAARQAGNVNRRKLAQTYRPAGPPG